MVELGVSFNSEGRGQTAWAPAHRSDGPWTAEASQSCRRPSCSCCELTAQAALGALTGMEISPHQQACSQRAPAGCCPLIRLCFGAVGLDSASSLQEEGLICLRGSQTSGKQAHLFLRKDFTKKTGEEMQRAKCWGGAVELSCPFWRPPAGTATSSAAQKSPDCSWGSYGNSHGLGVAARRLKKELGLSDPGVWDGALWDEEGCRACCWARLCQKRPHGQRKAGED